MEFFVKIHLHLEPETAELLGLMRRGELGRSKGRSWKHWQPTGSARRQAQEENTDGSSVKRFQRGLCLSFPYPYDLLGQIIPYNLHPLPPPCESKVKALH